MPLSRGTPCASSTMSRPSGTASSQPAGHCTKPRRTTLGAHRLPRPRPGRPSAADHVAGCDSRRRSALRRGRGALWRRTSWLSRLDRCGAARHDRRRSPICGGDRCRDGQGDVEFRLRESADGVPGAGPADGRPPRRRLPVGSSRPCQLRGVATAPRRGAGARRGNGAPPRSRPPLRPRSRCAVARRPPRTGRASV